MLRTLYYVGYIKGVGKIHQPTFIDTYSKLATVKLYDRKIALVAADMLNDRIVSLFDQYGIPLLRVLTDKRTEYCGAREHHEYQLYLAIENIEHSKTKAKSLKPMVFVNVFTEQCKMSSMQPPFVRRFTINLEELQADVDVWLEYYNNERARTGKHCYGKTPIQTWVDSIHRAKEKILSNHYQNVVSFSLSGKKETSSAGKQPASDNLTDWNGQGERKSIM